MDKFFSTGSKLTLAFWVLPLGGLMNLFGDPWSGRFVTLGVIILAAHVLELVLKYGALKERGRAGPMDIVMVLLLGLFYWMPILNKPAGR